MTVIDIRRILQMAEFQAGQMHPRRDRRSRGLIARIQRKNREQSKQRKGEAQESSHLTRSFQT